MSWSARRYAEGWSLERIARAQGVARTTIANDLRLEGVPLRPRGRPRKVREDAEQTQGDTQ